MCMHVSTRRHTQEKREVSDDARFLKNLILACIPESYHVLLEGPIWRGWGGVGRIKDSDLLGQDTYHIPKW